MIQVYEDALNALLDLGELDGTREVVRAALQTLQTIQMAMQEGEMPASDAHDPVQLEVAIKSLEKLLGALPKVES
ncbi:MAG: hypothetical protein EB075_02550 [Bacteroidetes bacterium]|jgi:hypothetical protein|nr:hypothetical protein [Bacteroidota bacterium]